MPVMIDNDGNPVRLGQGQPTKQGHTPGPWRIGISDADIEDWSVDEDIISADGRWIAGALTVGAKRQAQRVSLVECQVNAALIAAAPWHALLLRAVLKGWRIHKDGQTRDTYRYGLYRPDADPRSWDADFNLGDVNHWQNGLPACPDAETYERIRLAVEGE